MKICYWGKDGGPESKVWGFWLIEAKSLFSIALLKFEDGSREAFHSHAFNAISFILKGRLFEDRLTYKDETQEQHRVGFLPNWCPIITKRDNTHKVASIGTTWVLTFRGPWDNIWHEWVNDKFITLTHGRKVVA